MLARQVPLLSAGAALVLAGVASAQTTYLVNKGNPGDPPAMADEICTIVEFATFLDGDIISVRPGTYAPIDLSNVPVGISLTIEFDPDPLLPLQAAIIDATATSFCASSGQSSAVRVTGGQDRRLALDGFTLTGGAAALGGGLFIADSQPTIRNCTISGNDATVDGGGVYVTDDHPLVGPLFENCLLSDNDAGSSGGGMYVEDSPVRLEDCRFEGNTAGLDGGGLSVTNLPINGSTPDPRRIDVDLIDTDFIHNSALGGDGGGVQFTQNTLLRFRECDLVDNDAAERGGGIFTYEGSVLELDYCVIEDNDAFSGGGGGVYYSDTVSVAAVNSSFLMNRAPSGGGMLGENLISIPMPASFERCLFAENQALIGSGGGSLTIDYALSLDFCTFSQNDAGGGLGGGAAHLTSFAGAPLGITNCIFWADTALITTGAAKEISVSGPAAATVSFTDWQAGTGDPLFDPASCIDVDPRFATDPTPPIQQPNGDYCLDLASPCVDAGTGAPAGRTAVSGALDVGQADMGFHYDGPVAPLQNSYLSIDTSTVPSLGFATLTMSSPVAAPGATRFWFMGGSVTGTSPGIPWQGLLIPLRYDGYTQSILTGTSWFFDTASPPNPIPFFGVMPASGSVSIQVQNPGLLAPGTNVFHAYWIHEFFNVGLPSQFYVAQDASNPVVFEAQ